MSETAPEIILRDSTLREGFDTPGMELSREDGPDLLRALARAGVPEAEIVAPARVLADLPMARLAKEQGIEIALTGLVYSNRPKGREHFEAACEVLDRVDWIVPLSAHREPREPAQKLELVDRTLGHRPAVADGVAVGVGLPHCTQVPLDFVVQMAERAAAAGADRITLYDTNGSGEPFGVRAMVGAVTAAVGVPVLFHGHDDLGLATANSWAAVLAGASALDVCVNGLGDRAGNASLEQLAMLLHLNGRRTGIDVGALRELSQTVARISGVQVPRHAPVVGEQIFDHESPSHLSIPGEFEAFSPELVGGTRRIAGRIERSQER